MSAIADIFNEWMRRLLALPVQASAYARQVDALHYLEMLVMVLLTAVVGVAVIVFCVRYRRREGQRTPRVVVPLRVEVVVYGAILAFFIGLWLIGYRQFLASEQAPPGALEVYVTGKQWMWKFAYPQSGATSLDTLYVPAGRPVRLLLTSRDVIHSFFIPALRLKRDAVPGLYTSIWFEARQPGRHPIFCTELCGVGHPQMLAELHVLAPAAFEAWLASTAPAGGGANLVEAGRTAAARHGCLVCHTVDGGPAAASAMGPSWRNLYGSPRPLLTGGTTIADEAYLTRSMMDPVVEIVAGYPPLMPTYQGLLSAPETAAIVEFIKSLSGPPPDQELPVDAP